MQSLHSGVKISKSDSKEFNQISGMSTKHWGPNLWNSLFVMIMGAYPPVLDRKNPEHVKIKKAFLSTLQGLQYTLPCSFCRISYKQFYKDLPIETFTFTRISMMYWLYLVKDKVNKKLLSQEIEYLNKVYLDYKNKKITRPQYLLIVNSCFMSKPSPPFIEVLRRYNQYRATCSKTLKKCVLPDSVKSVL